MADVFLLTHPARFNNMIRQTPDGASQSLSLATLCRIFLLTDIDMKD
jgi:hypothetical protein